MAPGDVNAALLPLHSSRTESPEPLSPTLPPEQGSLNPPSRRRRRHSRGQYAYSTIEESRSRTPSPSPPTATQPSEPTILSTENPPSNQPSGSAQDDGHSAVNLDPTPEGPAEALLPKKPKPADVIIYRYENDACVGDGMHLKTVDDVRAFLESLSSAHLSSTDFLLLIEDISNDVIQTLADNLDFNPSTVTEHVKGRVNDDGSEKRKSGLHVDKIQSTLFDHITRRDNQESLTWWKLFSHSRTGYTREKEALDVCGADTRKMTVPHFEVHISDTFRDTAPAEMDIRVRSVATTVKTQWQKQKEMASRKKSKEAPLSKEHNLGLTAERSHPEQRSRKVHKLDAKTYRPHQVITEVKKDTWGAAAEERITFTKLEREGSRFYILLFDKPRGIRQYTQKVSVNDMEDQSGSILSKFLARDVRSEVTIKSEKAGDVFSTFLSDKTITKRSRPGKSRARSQTRRLSAITSTGEVEKTTEVHPLPTSTRERFLTQAQREGLFGRQKSRLEGRDNIVRKAKLAFSAMIAQDWNLVLSQMSLTLDEIDTKMSDNIMLQENALAWRRLLCSWRVSLVEYATRIEESKQVLRAQMSVRMQPSSSTLVGTASTIEISRRPTPSNIEDVANRSLEDVQSILYLYQVLTDGVRKIEQRVDRSFQAIMSSMSIIESERAITQGVAIARLTELAFIFIPLSFAAAFFSMQVKDFAGNNQPRLRHFFALGIALIFSLYCLRAFIRSTMLATFVRNMERKIRETSRVPGTEDIPARVVVSFAWQQLGVLSRTLLLVVPFFIIALVLIATLSHHKVFKALGSVLLVIGTITMIAYIFGGRYLASFRTSIILVWILSLLGAGLGGETSPNPAVMGTICTIVTTVCVIALAVIPQDFTYDPDLLAMRILAPLWVLELPIAILCHYYQSSKWAPYQLSLGIMPFVLLFGILSSWLYNRSFRWIPQTLGVGAVTLGIPLSLVWSYWPLRNPGAPLYGQLLVTCFSVAVFIWILALCFEDDVDDTTFLAAYLAVLVGLPLIMAWSYKSSHGTQLPLYGQLLVTLAAVGLLSWTPYLYMHLDLKKKKAWLTTYATALVGAPMVMVWCYAPSHGDRIPLYAKLIVTVASIVVCSAAYQFTIYRRLTEQSIFLGLLLGLVGIPTIVVWAVLPQTGTPFPLYGKICVTLGSIIVLCFVVRLINPFAKDQDWRVLSWLVSGMTLAAWIPTIVWTIDTKALEPIRRSRAIMIHVTWTSILFWLIVWPFVWHYGFSLTRVRRSRRSVRSP
ncbi:uncharacterized protein BDR25DRAFT_303198 [Lindgomyces ingoldianus]|uniref:Uncharacterized protein n=1 Tax=Lindgomyces ingoldianus TaxID=673940 RepID=A0ACB6R0F3_9PLEO|nr:uncharacterized protein BDR25DRAFT_303198 [Lindgomyces ingoldianus]KAF2471800.1 hypothetical protein BDR25DRAFT_303198 [Lindgomyces ingoldianus]